MNIAVPKILHFLDCFHGRHVFELKLDLDIGKGDVLDIHQAKEIDKNCLLFMVNGDIGRDHLRQGFENCFEMNKGLFGAIAGLKDTLNVEEHIFTGLLGGVVFFFGVIWLINLWGWSALL